MHAARMSWSKLLFEREPRALLWPSTSGSKNTDKSPRINFVGLPLLAATASSSCLAVRKTPYPGTSSTLACMSMHKWKSMYYDAYSPHYYLCFTWYMQKHRICQSYLLSLACVSHLCLHVGRAEYNLHVCFQAYKQEIQQEKTVADWGEGQWGTFHWALPH